MLFPEYKKVATNNKKNCLTNVSQDWCADKNTLSESRFRKSSRLLRSVAANGSVNARSADSATSDDGPGAARGSCDRRIFDLLYFNIPLILLKKKKLFKYFQLNKRLTALSNNKIYKTKKNQYALTPKQKILSNYIKPVIYILFLITSVVSKTYFSGSCGKKLSEDVRQKIICLTIFACGQGTFSVNIP